MLRKFDYSVVQLPASSFDDRCHPFIVVSADSRAVSLSQLLFLFTRFALRNFAIQKIISSLNKRCT